QLDAGCELELHPGRELGLDDHGRPQLSDATVSRRVAVLSGGRSSEHEISVASAHSVAAALEGLGIEVVRVEIDRSGAWALGAAPPPELAAGNGSSTALARLPERAVTEALTAVDVVFPILHGPFGEDGTVQGLLELADVPYVGPGVAASALCMDKDLFKAVMRDRGIPVTRNGTI